ncbi:MAG: pyruvate kinase [Candidatus Tectomicrobia bacterium]|uniref:Pyruvate kinase n=1 Tax=Tectimicrobiota bacterium TaxID=2528274 RepID=A0A937W3V1_UNCTE|nr:pyruvate kinase [Candidatus Tectomicrobia bacterium]
MRRHRRVKIVATLGPASQDPQMIYRLFEAGADVFRINMSHADHRALQAAVAAIRRVEHALKRPIGILVDLQGPKLRIGSMIEGGAELRTGSYVRLDLDTIPGDATRLGLPHREVFAVLTPGKLLLLDDGRLRLRITEVASEYAMARVEQGGHLTDRKGVNVPDAVLPVAALSAKDYADLEAALALNVDWIALSFVQRPADVAEAKQLVAGRAGVLAKLEKPAALDQLDAIIALSDALMVARGDLGVELPLEYVPGWQKHIIRAARQAGKPVVVATQMLESMVSSPTPTRAEVSDVATAVFEGADAIMLSAESAAGQYPEEAVAMMDRIARAIEEGPHYRAIIDAQHHAPDATSPDAIVAASRQVAETLHVAAIVSWTSSGSTGLRAARERPSVPIIALTPVQETGRRLALTWGLHCVVTGDAHDFEDMVERACDIALQEGFATVGAAIVVTAGVPLGTPGATNLLRIAQVGRHDTAVHYHAPAEVSEAQVA